MGLDGRPERILGQHLELAAGPLAVAHLADPLVDLAGRRWLAAGGDGIGRVEAALERRADDRAQGHRPKPRTRAPRPGLPPRSSRWIPGVQPVEDRPGQRGQAMANEQDGGHGMGIVPVRRLNRGRQGQGPAMEPPYDRPDGSAGVPLDDRRQGQGPRCQGRRPCRQARPLTTTAVALATGLLVGWPVAHPLSAPAAAGHSQLILSDPTAGAVLPVSPTEISLVFSEAIEPAYSSLDLLDGRGQTVLAGVGSPSDSDPEVLVAAIATPLAGQAPTRSTGGRPRQPTATTRPASSSLPLARGRSAAR